MLFSTTKSKTEGNVEVIKIFVTTAFSEKNVANNNKHYTKWESRLKTQLIPDCKMAPVKWVFMYVM